MARRNGTTSFHFTDHHKSSLDSFGEAHALADLLGDPSAAAAIHYAIAALIPEHGYALKAYPCKYNHHYRASRMERKWGANRIHSPHKELIEVAKWAVRNRELVENTHSACVPQPYVSLTDPERRSAVLAFQKRLGELHAEQVHPISDLATEARSSESDEHLGDSSPPVRTNRIRSTVDGGRGPATEATVELQSEGLDFSPGSEIDARERVARAIAQRRGQSKFRKILLNAYSSRCCISGCGVIAILEAAHIEPYLGDHTNHPQNGLLLRSDIHALFDLGLLWIEPNAFTVELDDSLLNSEYWALRGKPIRLPASEKLKPSRAAIESRARGRRHM